MRKHPKMSLARTFSVLAVALASTAGLAWAGPATVTLKDGRRITAPILKETGEALWLDLGHDVLRLPRERIEQVERDEQSAPQDAAPVEAIFRTLDDPPERSPRALSEIYGEAVILVSTPSGLGSGFIVHPDGYAVTNAHVIQRETDIKCTVYEQDALDFRRRVIEDVEIVAVNSHHDLALLKMEHPDEREFAITYISPEDILGAGDDVFAIGNPLGLERSLSRGVVSNPNRNFEGLVFIQTTAEINPGNSGGPLFNLRGEVVGVTTMHIPFGEGLGFAIPARYVRDFLRHREAFAYDKDNPNSGYDYKAAPPRLDFDTPDALRAGDRRQP